MYHRVVMTLVFSVAIHQFLQIRCTEYRHEVVNHPRYAYIKVVARNIIEEIPQERIRLGNKTCSLLTTEILWRIIMQTGRKHSVCNGLCIDVSKVGKLQVLN